MDNTQPLGEKIRALRIKCKLTQPALAEKVGVNPHTIKDYEAGRRSPPMKKLVLIARELGVAVSDLVSSEAPIPLELPASHALKKYLKIPDDIIERAQAHELNGKVWEYVRIAFDEVEAVQIQKHKTKKTLG